LSPAQGTVELNEKMHSDVSLYPSHNLASLISSRRQSATLHTLYVLSFHIISSMSHCTRHLACNAFPKKSALQTQLPTATSPETASPSNISIITRAVNIK